MQWCLGNQSWSNVTEHANPYFFPMIPLDCTAQISNSPQLLHHAPASKVCVCVCVRKGSAGGRAEGRRIPAQGRAAPRRGTARKGFAEESCCPLKTLCHNNPLLCLVMLDISSIQMLPSQTCVHLGCGSRIEHLFSSETCCKDC